MKSGQIMKNSIRSRKSSEWAFFSFRGKTV